MTHPHPAAVAAAEKIHLVAMTDPEDFAMKAVRIISDAITAALSAPSPVGDGATPRTERFRNCSNPNLPEEVVAWSFARQLERELAAAKKDLSRAHDALDRRDASIDVHVAELTALREQVRALEEDKANFEWMACALEDVNIGEVDPTKHMTEMMDWPEAWRRAIRAARPASGGEAVK